MQTHMDAARRSIAARLLEVQDATLEHAPRVERTQFMILLACFITGYIAVSALGIMFMHSATKNRDDRG